LDYHKYHLKSISFLPKLESGAYAQMPYEAISKEKYAEMKGAMGNIELMQTGEDVEAELFCNNDTCVI